MIRNPHLVKLYTALGGGFGGEETGRSYTRPRTKTTIFSIILKAAGGKRWRNNWVGWIAKWDY